MILQTILCNIILATTLIYSQYSWSRTEIIEFKSVTGSLLNDSKIPSNELILRLKIELPIHIYENGPMWAYGVIRREVVTSLDLPIDKNGQYKIPKITHEVILAEESESTKKEFISSIDLKGEILHKGKVLAYTEMSTSGWSADVYDYEVVTSNYRLYMESLTLHNFANPALTFNVPGRQKLSDYIKEILKKEQAQFSMQGINLNDIQWEIKSSGAAYSVNVIKKPFREKFRAVIRINDSKYVFRLSGILADTKGNNARSGTGLPLAECGYAKYKWSTLCISNSLDESKKLSQFTFMPPEKYNPYYLTHSFENYHHMIGVEFLHVTFYDYVGSNRRKLGYLYLDLGSNKSLSYYLHEYLPAKTDIFRPHIELPQVERAKKRILLSETVFGECDNCKYYIVDTPYTNP